jgi:hypothetical protein
MTCETRPFLDGNHSLQCESFPLNLDRGHMIHARSARRMFSAQSCYFGTPKPRLDKAHHSWKLLPAPLLLVRVVDTTENLDTYQSVLMRFTDKRRSPLRTRIDVLKQCKSQANTIRCLLHQPLAQCMHVIISMHRSQQPPRKGKVQPHVRYIQILAQLYVFSINHI